MVCYVHPQSEPVGTCVGCGKFICSECCTEVKGKYYCKTCIGELITSKDKQIDKLENKATAQPVVPNVYMNAGGASSSSSSSSAASSGGYRRPYPRQSILVHILLFFFTAGIGNIFYFFYMRNKQNHWY